MFQNCKRHQNKTIQKERTNKLFVTFKSIRYVGSTWEWNMDQKVYFSLDLLKFKTGQFFRAIFEWEKTDGGSTVMSQDQ